MASILPIIPRFVLTIFEPISLSVIPSHMSRGFGLVNVADLSYRRIAGAIAPLISAEWFIAEQLPGKPLEAISQNSRMVALQLGNIYLLLAMVGIAVLYTTSEARVVRNYVIALWIADIGHVAVTCWVMDYESLLDFAGWNAMTWGNIGVTVSC
jgi:hypothetical protein